MSYKVNSNIIRKNTKKRPAFVYMASSMREGVGLEIWQGILKKTREIDADLICYIGGELGESHTSLIYNLINTNKIDGIICWAVSIHNIYESFYDKFKGFPFIALSVPIPGFPVVMADSYQGMRDMVEHLVKKHSYTKIAFVRGPEKHIYAEQRYKAYLDVVKENNIYNENLITAPSTWQPASGVEGLRILLDDRNLKPGKDIEAVVFINDNHAIAAFDELTHRKIYIPEQLAITGYNSTKEAQCTTSPITNVQMPFFNQGNTAVDLLMKLLNNEEIPMKITLPSKLVVAQSCGCQSAVIEKAAANKEIIIHKKDNNKLNFFSKANEDSSKTMSRDAITEDIIADLKEYAKNNEKTGSALAEYSGILLKALFDEIENNRQGEFLRHFNEFVRKLINKEKKFEFLQDIISIFRGKFYMYTNKTSMIHLAEELWSQARILLAEASARAKDKATLTILKQEAILRELSVRLLTNNDISRLMNILAESLPILNIPGCYLVLYENQAGIKSLYDLPEKARLIFAYENGNRKELNTEGIIYPLNDLLPEELSTHSKQKAIVVYSLNFNDIQLGFALFELGPEEASIYFTISYLLSSAIYGAFINKQSENVNTLLQETLNNVQHKSEVVSSRSNNISRNVNDISTSMEEVAASVGKISENIMHVMEIVKDAVNITKGANTDITDFANESIKIGEITEIIINIAEQTKILAINAAIEAARAGDKGKGFSIVAKEVSNLAKRTVASTDKITSMVKTIQSRTCETAAAITRVADTIDKVSDLSVSITSSISKQVTVTNEISELLITAAQGSKEIYQAISELVKLANVNKDTGENFQRGEYTP